MPIRVTLRVKRSSPLVHERHPIAKKQRTTQIPELHNNITDGSAACDNSAGSESPLCQPSYDPHSLHKTSTRTSNQITSQAATADHGEISSFNSSKETSLGSLSNHESESPTLNNEELPCEEELKYKDMAQNSTEHGGAAIPLAFAEIRKKQYQHWHEMFKELLNKKKEEKETRWDERFKELVDFKEINGHANFPTKIRPLGGWVRHQRRQYSLLKEGKESQLTIDKCEKLESIGFEFKRQPRSPWDERFQELVNFKKINGHANVPQRSGTLGGWVGSQRKCYSLWQKGKHSPLTTDKYERLESIGFEFKCGVTTLNNKLTEHPCDEELKYEDMAQNSTGHGRAAKPFVLKKKRKKKKASWDERFKELVDFKKINGHANVPTNSEPFGTWITNQRAHYQSLQEGKDSPLTIDKRKKLESIGFEFKLNRRATSYITWDQRFQELVDYKKINGHANVLTHSGQLGRWITTQRMRYRLLKEGKYSPLTIDECEKLESIGLEFKCRPTYPSWDERFQELVDYKKINGHTNARTHSGPLGRWACCQRRHYRLLQDGKHSPLTIDKSKKLESIGFEFTYRAVVIHKT
eukprot:scaffold71170_cov54-Attheya_sp.AAC.1